MLSTSRIYATAYLHANQTPGDETTCYTVAYLSTNPLLNYCFRTAWSLLQVTAQLSEHTPRM